MKELDNNQNNDQKHHQIRICVATYQRPDRLKTLLESILGLMLPDVGLGLIVVDNDPQGSAETVVESLRETFPYPIRFAIEATPGISAARNRLVKEARDEAVDWIVFVDDDEQVESNWLVELWRAAEKYSADGVLGPVNPLYPASTPVWIREGDFMGRRRPQSGTKLRVFNTGNVLLKLSVLSGMDQPFDDSFGLSGGSDTMLSMQLASQGVNIVWCNEAIVWEPVEESRLNLSWILKRAFRSGSVYSRVRVIIDSRPRTRLNRLAKGSVRILSGILMLPLDLVRLDHKVALARSLQSMARGLGSILGALGVRGYQEYRR